MAEKLTDRSVKLLPAPASGNQLYFDSQVRGFAIRITRAGSRSFVLNYRTKADARQRRWTIGNFPDWSTTAARHEAMRLKREVSLGADPVAQASGSRAAPTVADLAERFLREYVPRKRAATQRDYISQIKADILPAIGRLKVASVTAADVDDLHRTISARAPTHANRVLAVLSKMFSMAIRWGWRTDNPCKGIERNQEHRRHRYLTGAELARLATALAKLPDIGAANAVRLALLTGARRGELLAARWADFDLTAGVWTKPGATTKQKTLHRVPLSDVAIRLLVEMRKHAGACEWVFPAPLGGHRKTIREAWDWLRVAADIKDVRLHDCRHTFASISASAGASLPLIGALLGHTTPMTTARYAHLLDDPQRAAANKVAALITGAVDERV